MNSRLIDQISQTYAPVIDRKAIALFWSDLPAEKQAALAAARPLVETMVAGSPYLRGLLLHHTDFAIAVLAQDPAETLHGLCANVAAAAYAEGEAAIMASLRQRKAEAALFIAMADIGGAWTVDQVTDALTHFADAALGAAVNFLLLAGHQTGKLALADTTRPDHGSGYVVLAMGKHGAYELNYSSDIDLIVLYDPETAPLAIGVEPATYFPRLTKKLVTLLQDITEDGYAFRVDLRLRPDPRATQVAISLEAAANYYESMGQNWERAAMIKARPAAGDLALGNEFLARLSSYIWRKYLDFAAIADVQSLKRQIHAVKGHGEIAIHGHNLKLGRGGIREIEFFVQTQQLIAGGRNPNLRGKRTLDMLDALAAAQWITPAAAAELQGAYRFLRTIEHRIQMVADQQTHNLPESDVDFEALARLSGFAETAAFAAKIRKTLELVQNHYAALFADAPELGNSSGNLVFTGGEDDPGTIETLEGMGFTQASEVSATIRGWHFGRYSATRSSKSRELLTELMPALLQSLARNGDADQAFLAFDRFIAKLPAGVQLFSMLKANPRLLDLIANILSIAPRLAEQLSSQPRILEGVLDRGFFGPLPQAAETKALVASTIQDDVALDEVVDRVRVLGREQMFRVGVRVLTETLSAGEAGQGFSQLAEILLQRLHRAVETEMAAKHGHLAGGRSAIMAMGKLGGREMTAGSDLDLILVYDAKSDADVSDGPKPMAVNPYFTKLTQRLISSITAPTAEGTLFEVDMRLRPSGNKGPVATSLASFIDYHGTSSWTWEKLALTRARVVSGDESLIADLNAAIPAVLCAPRDAAATRKDVLDMRRLMVREQSSTGVWDIKRSRGGLVEVEFIAQYLQLVHGPANSAVLDTNTEAALRKLRDHGALDQNQAAILLEAWQLYSRITQVLRLCLSGPFDPATATKGLNETVSRAATMPDIAATEAAISATQRQVAAIFDEIIGTV